MKIFLGLALLFLTGIAAAEDTWVNGYYRKDGTYVSGYYRSSPNAYKWDNKSYTPSQDLYNQSYDSPSKNYSPSYYTPSTTRFNDNNPYNDYPNYSYPKRPSYRSPYNLYNEDE